VIEEEEAMEACSVTVTGILAYEPELKQNQNGDPRLTLTLKVSTRANRTRWIKVTAYGLLAVRSAESYHEGDRLTLRGDDLDSWGRIDDRDSDSRFRGNAQDEGPRIQTWVYIIAYDIAASTQNDTVTTGRAMRQALQGDPTTEPGAHFPEISSEERANREVIAGVS
jgi:hypothetical protein